MYEPVIDGAVRIEEKEPALAVSPVYDVLADEVLEELRLARAGAPRHVEMPAPLFFREHERLAATYARGDEQAVTGRSSHKPHRAPRSGGGVQDTPKLCLCEEKRATGQLEGLYGCRREGSGSQLPASSMRRRASKRSGGKPSWTAWRPPKRGSDRREAAAWRRLVS